MVKLSVSKARKLIRILAVPEWRRAFFGHFVAAGVEHLHILKTLGNINTVVDIGANRGQFALVTKSCYPEALIISFEPLPEPAAAFTRVFMENQQVLLHNYAIGPETGRATIHVSESDDSSSLLPITELQNKLFPGTAEQSTQSIQIGRLSDFVKEEQIVSPALLKLDVQGFELQALKGCESLLPYFNWIYCECSFVSLYDGQALADEVIGWLRDKYFWLHGVYNMTYDGNHKSIQADFLFNRSGN